MRGIMGKKQNDRGRVEHRKTTLKIDSQGRECMAFEAISGSLEH